MEGNCTDPIGGLPLHLREGAEESYEIFRQGNRPSDLESNSEPP